MKNRIITISLLFFTLLATQQVFAQQNCNQDRQAKKKAMKAFKTDASAYAQENILPVLQAQRTQLDRQLSAAEQQELAGIRSELQKMRDAHKEHKQQMRAKNAGERPTERPEPTQEQIEEMRAAKKAKRKLMDRVWAIADAHETAIYTLLDEMKSDQQDWKEDLELLKEQHLSELKPAHEEPRQIKPEHAARKGKHIEGRHRGHGPLDMLKKVMHEPVAFLLWDGEVPARPERGNLDEKNDVTVFPNPTHTSNQLTYQVEKTGLVTIKLMDDQGVTLKTLSSKSQETGTYTERFSLEGLAPGTYYYQVKTATEKIVKRFVIE